MLQLLVCVLVRTLASLSGQNDVHEFIDGILFVSQSWSPIQKRQDPGNLSNETDAFVNTRTSLLARFTCGQGVALWFGENTFRYRGSPQANGRWERACAVVEITPLRVVGRPARRVCRGRRGL